LAEIRMDIRRLEFFVRIAELGSMTRAAASLGISQPPLSRQMRLLEEELGTPLFQRHRRGLHLTPAGTRLKQRLQAPLHQIRLALQDARCSAGEDGGVVTIGMAATISHILAGPLAQQVALVAPQVSLRIVEAHPDNLVGMLDQEQIDMALVFDREPSWKGPTEDLLVEELMLVGSAESALSPDQPVQFKDLHGYPLVLPPQLPYQRSIVNAIRDLSGHEPKIAVIADSFQHTKGSIVAGLGYSFLSTASFRREARLGEMRYAPIVNPVLTRKVVMATAPQALLQRASKLILKLVRQEITDLVARGDWPATLCAPSPLAPASR
jgi:DNA-binding transcriptional LysR family regulator